MDRVTRCLLQFLLTATGVLFHRRDVQVEQRNVTNMAAALVQAVQRRPQHYTMRQLRDGFKGNQPSKYKQGTARVAHTAAASTEPSTDARFVCCWQTWALRLPWATASPTRMPTACCAKWCCCKSSRKSG